MRNVARRRAVLLVGVAAVAVSVAWPLPAAADVSDFSFTSLDADYTLGQDAEGVATLDVVETFVADFPQTDQNRGILRDIPKYYLGVDTDVRVKGVTDQNGTAVPYEQSDTGDYVELALGTDDFVHGKTTYVISYSEHYVVGHYENTDDDEFYWDVNGTGWEQPFGRVTATVHVDPSIVPDLTGHNACYQGAFESNDRCTLAAAADGSTFTVTQEDLGPGENVTVAIGFESGTFVQGDVTQPGEDDSTPFGDPDVPAPLWATVLAILLGAGSIALLVIAIIARVRRSLAAPKAGFIVPQYSVPEGLDVMVAAHLVGRASTAVPAALVSLAVRQKLRILDYPVTNSGADYTLQYLSDEGLSDLDERLMHTLFGGTLEPGETRELAPHDATLGAAVTAISTDAKAQLRQKGLVEQRGLGCLLPGLAVIPVVGAFLVTFAAGMLSGGFSAAAFGVAFLSIVLLVATAIVNGGGRQVRTVEGQRLHDYLEGMKLYLTVAEEDRIRMLQSPQGAERVDVGDTHAIIKLYEKLLPFAVIWGVEDEWSKELQIRAESVQQSPDWFVSQGAFNAIAFTSTLHGLSSAATYVPSSSGTGSGSGFSSFGGGSFGGGFSGGGGGGGGGGGR